MIYIQPDEELIEGKWVPDANTHVADETCQRIEWLVSKVLKFIGTDESGWDTLYQDVSDGRYWLLCYPASELHGGGPPSLRALSQTGNLELYVDRTTP